MKEYYQYELSPVTAKEAPKFLGEYCKYFPDRQHIALFAQYPAQETEVLICRKCNLEGSNLQYLLKTSSGKEIGFYTPVATVYSEEEAIAWVQRSQEGDALLRKLLGGMVL